MQTPEQKPKPELLPAVTTVAKSVTTNPDPLKLASAPQTITPKESRDAAVGDALANAYAAASMLVLSPEEKNALAADFPDEAFSIGAGGDPDLVYIEHAYLRQRLNQVLGLGASVPIRRREWAEDFAYFKDGRSMKATRVYADVCLVVRGCLVAEAIGASVYYPANQKLDYSDALEAAKSNAFRRCAKEFGVGLQAWMKGWCVGWKERNVQASKTRQEYVLRKPTLPKGNENCPDQTRGQSEAPAKSQSTGEATVSPVAANTGDDYPRCFQAIVPVPRQGQKRNEYMKNPDTIGELYLAAQGGNQDAARRLFGFVAHFEAKGWVDTKGNAHPPSDVDVQFRFNLDEFNDWHEAKKNNPPRQRTESEQELADIELIDG